MRHKCAKFKLDPKNLSTLGVRHNARGHQWPDRPCLYAAIVGREDQMPMALSGADSRTFALGSTMRNLFNIRRVRQPFLIDKAHATVPQVCALQVRRFLA